MQSKFFSATVYAKVQPKPLVGDEIHPFGCVGIAFEPTPSLDILELSQLITDLQTVCASMKRPQAS